MSGNNRASVMEPEDAIMIDPDPANNNTARAAPTPTSNPGTNSSVQIGVPEKDFNIYNSVLYSHHYYEKVQPEPGADVRAKCLPCWIEKKKEVFLKISDGNIRGML